MEAPPQTHHNRDLSAPEGATPYIEEVADLQGFTPARAHLLLWEVYGDLPHHKYGMQLTGGVPDDNLW